MMRTFALAGLCLTLFSGCELVLDGLSDPEDRLCTPGNVPTTPAGADPAQVEAEVAAICERRQSGW